MKVVKILFAILVLTILTASAFAYNYYDALLKATYFFDANKCGPNAGTDSVVSSWRSACHTQDGSTVSLDLTGGYHDAGDHVKFGLPQCWSAATLGWALYEYRATFDTAGVSTKLLSVIKYFTDYFLKCHPNASIFYYQVGDGNADHGYWGAPENQTGTRPVISAPPGADVCGEAAAALALMYLNYKSTNSAYATQCLTAAKEIFNIGMTGLGRSSDGSGGSFYKSTSHFDDLGWASIWLSVATGDSSLLSPIDAWLDVPNDPGDNHYQKKWAPAWDDVHLFVMLKMAELTGMQKYIDGVVWNLTYFRDTLQKTPKGLPWLDQWGCLRYASDEAGMGFLTYKLLGLNTYYATGNLTMDYCLGTNERNASYVTNYLTSPPVHPHHRANEPQQGGPTHGMVGALVGGPSNDGSYVDSVGDYTHNEVAIDYNAAYILGLAGRAYFANGGTAATPAPTPTAAPSSQPGTGDGLLGTYYDNTDFTSLKLTRVDPIIDFSWAGGVPDPSLSADSNSARWTGQIEARFSDVYTFYMLSDDGSRIWINNQLIIDDWRDHGATPEYEAKGMIALTMGTKYDIKIEQLESSGDWAVHFSWSCPWSTKEIVPQSQLYSGSTNMTPDPTPVATPEVTPDTTPVPTVPACVILGDVNSSGEVDIVDALLVAQYYVGLAPAQFAVICADVNCSGSIDIVDALIIAQCYVGLPCNKC
jgi:endoglucanase